MSPPSPSRGFLGNTLQDRWLAGVRIVEQRHPAHQTLPWHGHDDPYVTLVAHGGYRERSAAGETECGAGTLIVHPPGEWHLDEFSHRPSRLLNLELRPDALSGLGIGRGAFDRRTVLQGQPAAVLLGRLRQELQAPDDLTPLVVQGVLLEIATLVLREDRVELSAPAWLREAERWIARSFLKTVTLQEVASQVGVHPHHLARGFRQHLGTTLGERLRRLRVDYALDLLRSDLPLAEVALAAGFCDQSHFTRCFARLMGRPPGAYRGRVRKPR